MAYFFLRFFFLFTADRGIGVLQGCAFESLPHPSPSAPASGSHLCASLARHLAGFSVGVSILRHKCLMKTQRFKRLLDLVLRLCSRTREQKDLILCHVTCSTWNSIGRIGGSTGKGQNVKAWHHVSLHRWGRYLSTTLSSKRTKENNFNSQRAHRHVTEDGNNLQYDCICKH